MGLRERTGKAMYSVKDLSNGKVYYRGTQLTLDNLELELRDKGHSYVVKIESPKIEYMPEPEGGRLPSELLRNWARVIVEGAVNRWLYSEGG